MRKCENFVDLEKCCKMSLLSLSEMPIQPRASLVKFDHLDEKSEKDSISNLSTKVVPRVPPAPTGSAAGAEARKPKATAGRAVRGDDPRFYLDIHRSLA